MGFFKSDCSICGKTFKNNGREGYAIRDKATARLLYEVCHECYSEFQRITDGVPFLSTLTDNVELPKTAEEMKHIIENGPNASREKRMRCNVCGEIFCYSFDDIARNKQLMEEAKSARNRAAMEALGGTFIASNQHTARADNFEAQIADYSKCPKCHSADLTEISADEFKASKNTQMNGSNTVSSADELKKFKELLDMGVISQEEFDAKKKQLLGL